MAKNINNQLFNKNKGSSNTLPQGILASRTVAMPSDTNTHGDIFGGWLMSQMDLAGGIAAGQRAKGRIVTVAVEQMVFHLPVKVGNVVSCYSEIIKIGRTSIKIKIEVWAQRHDDLDEPAKVTEGIFTYVALDKDRRPRAVTS